MLNLTQNSTAKTSFEKETSCENTSSSFIDKKSHLKFFVECTSETIGRTMLMVHQLQLEVNKLREEIMKTENECKNLSEGLEEKKLPSASPKLSNSKLSS